MQESLTEMLQFVRKNLHVESSLSTNGSVRTNRKLQHIFSIKHPDKKCQQLYEIFLSHVSAAEKSCPGAGALFAYKCAGIEKKIELIENKFDLSQLLVSRGYDKKILSLLTVALENATLDTRFSIKQSSTNNSYIDVSTGYAFDAPPLINSNPISLTDVHVFCIDGYIESASEVNRLLTELSLDRKSALLFIRGTHDDVVHTIKVNNDRKTFFVMPFLVPFEPKSVNTLVDIAIVSGTDVVSSTKGDLISTVGLQKSGKLDSCIVSGSKIRCTNKSTQDRVSQHVNFLRETLKERNDIEEILSGRIKSLTSSCIDICIPFDMNYYHARQQLDEGIRTLSAVLQRSYDPKQVVNKAYESFVNATSHLEFT